MASEGPPQSEEIVCVRVPCRPRMSEAVTSGNVAVVLIYSDTCGRQCITQKVCAKTSHNTDRVAH